MIQIEKVYKTFHKGTINENPILQGLSLSLNSGDFATIIGSNGAGKSTMLNVIAGTTPVDQGRIQIGQHDVSKLAEHKRAHLIGRVFQDPMVGTAASLTIEENLALAMKRGGRRNLSFGVKNQDKAFFKEQLAQLGLNLETRLQDIIGLLSGGQRQSITLLMAALIKPQIILLDEHTAALDPKTGEAVMAITQKIIAEHKLTALMITHNLDHAIRFGNRLIMLHKGKVALDLSGAAREKLTSQELLSQFTQISARDS